MPPGTWGASQIERRYFEKGYLPWALCEEEKNSMTMQISSFHRYRFSTIKHLCFSSSISRKVFRWRASSHWVRSFHYRRHPTVWRWIWPRLSPVSLWCRTAPTIVSNLPSLRDHRHFYPTYGKLVQDYRRHSISHRRRNSMVIDRQLLSRTPWS